MAVQVLTNENMVDFIQNRTVPEFKPPEAEKPAEVKETPRGEDGKFVEAKKEEAKPAGEAKAEEVKTEVKPEVKAEHADDDDTSDLSESVKKKIDKLIAKKHRQMKEAEEFGRDEARRALAAEARAEELQKQIDALKAPAKSDGPDPGEPNPDDFKTVGEYTRALVKYEAKLVKEAAKAEKTEAAEADQQSKVKDRLIKQVAEARKEYADYADVMQSVTWEAPRHVADFILESDNGARMAYHLAKDADLYTRIADMTPVRALAELGKLEDKLFSKREAPEAAPDKPVSKAPPPIQPLDAKSTPVVTDPSKMDFKQLREYRESQKKNGQWRAF